MIKKNTNLSLPGSTQKNNLINNSFYLFVFQALKIIFPLISLPYLTRVLSTSAYGVVSYTKTIMTYMQLFVDFGFLLSGTKDIVNAIRRKQKIQKVVEEAFTARIVLGITGFILTLLISLVLPIARNNLLFTLLSYIPVFLTIFLFDFYFRGIEKMQIITIRFAIMKIVSTLLLFIFVKNDSNLILIPIFDILSSLLAVVVVIRELRRSNISIRISNLKIALRKIHESFIFFLSNATSTSLNAIFSIIIGIFLTESDVAFWGITMQIIGTIQAFSAPISDSVFPEMVKTKNISLIKKILKYTTPIIAIGTIMVYVISPLIIKILGGDKYIPAITTLQIVSPCIFFGYLAIMLGWPTLGAIDKQNETTLSTIISLLVVAFGITILLLAKNFTLITMAYIRILGDLSLFIIRLFFVIKYRKDFNHYDIKLLNKGKL